VPVNVEISLPVPAGYVYLDSTASEGTYNPVTGLWSVNGLVSFAHIQLRLRPENTGDHVIRANVLSSTAPDPNPANNSLTLAVTPTSNVDLRFEFFNFSPGTRSPGEEIAVLVDVLNSIGPAAADNVVVEFRVPAGFTFIRADTQMGTYDSAAGSWILAPMGTLIPAR